MTWVVDTSVLIDVAEDDARFGARSARALERHLTSGLVVCMVTYAELAPVFEGDAALQDLFLFGVGVEPRAEWSAQDTLAAHGGWHRHVQRRRTGDQRRRPLADVLIGAFAVRYEGLITRNAKDFRRLFPDLPLVGP